MTTSILRASWRLPAGLILVLLVAGCRDRDSDDGVVAQSTATTAASPTAQQASAQPSAAHIEPGDYERTVTVDGRERHYVLHAPPDIDASQPASLVLVLHGGGGNAANAERMSGFSALADREGFFVVYPDGSGRLGDALLTWNAGNCCGFALASEVDDTGFIRALVESLLTELPVDPKRVFVTGMSNGGMMSYRLACEAADLFAAAAPVAGALNIPNCSPSVPISLVAFHGTADQSVRYEGGEPEIDADRAQRIDTSVAESVGAFVQRNGCDETALTTRSGSIVADIYGGCSGGTGVALYTVEGGGHAWPGGRRGSAIGDLPTEELDATEVMWAFFESHPKP